MLHLLEKFTGVNPKNISLDDKETMKLIKSANTLGISELGTKFVRNMILENKPESFEDLVKISALSHGTDVWNNNAQDLIKNGTAGLKEVIACRDDIMNYLMELEIEKEIAFKIMETVRRGKPARKREEKWPNYVELMKKYGVPDWYIKSCEKIRYLFPRAHAINYVLNSFRIAYYKTNYPEAFYKVYFEVEANKKIDFSTFNNKEKILNKIKKLKESKNKHYENFQEYWDIDFQIEDCEIALEALDRGVVIENI